MSGKPIDPRVRVWRHVEKTSTCWLWTGGLNKQGYGLFSVNRKSTLAHKYLYELQHGPVPAGLELDHGCRVHRCVNPAHLEAVTHAVNVRRGESPAIRALRERLATGACKNGHPLSDWDDARCVCRTCTKEHRASARAHLGPTQKEWVAKNRERLNENQKRWADRNRERINEKQREKRRGGATS